MIKRVRYSLAGIAVVALGVAGAYVAPFGDALLAGVSNFERAAAQPAQSKSTKPAQPAPAQVPSQRTETTVYTAWTLTCTQTNQPNSKPTCSAVLRATEPKSKQVILAWIIAKDPQGVLRTVLQVPTGVLIQKGVELKMGSGGARTLPYTACMPRECEASIVLEDGFLRELKPASEATATIYAPDGKAVNINMDIKGIDRALAALGA